MNLHVSPQRATDSLLTQSNLRLRIGEHVVDVGALRIVTRPECPRLTSKAMAVLIELVRQVGATVTREQLLDRVWAGRVTTPDVLTQAIKELRRALADDAKPPRYIETIPKVGYRLIAPVLVLDGPGTGVLVEGGTASLPLAGASTDVTDEPAPEIARPAPPRPRIAAKAWAWGAAALVAIAALGHLQFRQDAGTAAAQRWQVDDLRALTSDPGAEYRPRLSPDASRVAFTAFDPRTQSERLVMRSVQPSQRIFLTQGGGAVEGLPVWSPDGQRIVFERIAPNYCEMFLVSGLGGPEQQVRRCRDAGSNYFDWTPDGRGLVSSERVDGGTGDFELFRFDLQSGRKEPLSYERTEGAQDLDARYSPDGRRLAFRRGLAPYSDLFVMPAEGGRPRQVTRISARIRGYAWMADNRTIVYSSDHSGVPSLYAVDVEDGRTQALGIAPAAYPDAARGSDAVVYEIIRTQERLKRLPLREGAPMRLLGPSTGNDYGAVLSPDGKRVAFTSDRSGRRQAWLYDFESEAATQLTDTASSPALSVRWNPGADRVLVVQRGDAVRQLVEIDLASRRQQVLSRADENVVFGDYDVDAESRLIAVRLSDKDTRLFRVKHAGTAGETRELLLNGIVSGQVDPATRSLYYTSSAVPGLHRRALDGDADEQVTPATLNFPRVGWRVAGGHVWYLADLGVRTANLREYDPANGSDRLAAELDLLLQGVDFDVTPARDALVFTPVDVEDTDVGIFRLSRTQAADD